MTTWNTIQEDNVTGSYGLAADETMARRVGLGTSAATLRLYTYGPCALVGRFQTVENEIHVEACQKNNIPINRRPTGGGAIVMGDGPLGVALTLPGTGQDTYNRAREMMARFSQGVVRGLASLGVEASFRGKNDIEVGGRKIAGLGIYRDGSSGLLFHCSLLVHLDMEMMLTYLNTPFEKISDKAIAAMESRLTTVVRETGRPVTLEEARQALAQGYAQTFGVSLNPATFTPSELSDIRVLETNKYNTRDWVYQQADVPDAMGSAKLKTAQGLLDVRVTLAGQTIKAAYVGGDFFAAESAVADLEGHLKWHSTQPEAIKATLEKVFAKRRDELAGLPLEPLADTLALAIRQAAEMDAQDAALYNAYTAAQAG